MAIQKSWIEKNESVVSNDKFWTNIFAGIVMVDWKGKKSAIVLKILGIKEIGTIAPEKKVTMNFDSCDNPHQFSVIKTSIEVRAVKDKKTKYPKSKEIIKNNPCNKDAGIWIWKKPIATANIGINITIKPLIKPPTSELAKNGNRGTGLAKSIAKVPSLIRFDNAGPKSAFINWLIR